LPASAGTANSQNPLQVTATGFLFAGGIPEPFTGKHVQFEKSKNKPEQFIGALFINIQKHRRVIRLA